MEQSELTLTKTVANGLQASFSPNGWEDVFVNEMPTECPITSCQVLDETCTDLKVKEFYQVDGSKGHHNVYADEASTKWAIKSTFKPTKEGFNSNICYKCSNKHYSKTVVIQDLKQHNVCVNSFEQAMKVITDPDTLEETTTTTPRGAANDTVSFEDSPARPILVGEALDLMGYKWSMSNFENEVKSASCDH